MSENQLIKNDKKLGITDIDTLKQSLENGDIVGVWENCDDFEKLAQSTIKTVQYVNEEKIRRLAEEINQSNNQMLNMTFEGVKKHHERKILNLKKQQKTKIVISVIVGFLMGFGIAWIIWGFDTGIG